MNENPEKPEKSLKQSAARILATTTAAWRKSRFLFPYLLAVVFTIILGVLAGHHEMWRDEIQAWLLSRDSHTPLALLHNMRYEGHPGLWHLILWPAAHLTWNPVAMQVIHVLIAGTAVFLLLRFSPFPFLVRMMIACGYFFAYEWAVIARNYAISVLLLFAICSLFEKRWQRFPYIAGLFFLLCHTNIHSIILTLVLTGFLMVEFAVAYAGKARDAHLYIRRVVMGFVIILAGLATGIKQTAPPSDSGYATTWYFRWTEQRVSSTAAKIIRADLPVPLDRFNFWNSNRFLQTDTGRHTEPAIPAEKQTVYGLMLLLCLALPFFKRPWPGLAYLSAALAMLSFFYVKYPGSIRHHGFIYLSLVAALWMSYYYTPWKAQWRIPEKVLCFIDRYRIAFFVPIFVVQIWGTAIAVKHDWSDTFSVAKEASEWLKQQYPDNDAVIYAAASGPCATAITGYLEVKSVFYMDADRFASYVTWDNTRGRKAWWKSVRQLTKLGKEDDRPIIFISDKRLGRHFAGRACDEIARFSDGIVGSENCRIYRLQ